MENTKMLALAEEFLAAWDSQDIDRVLKCYTEDLHYTVSFRQACGSGMTLRNLRPVGTAHHRGGPAFPDSSTASTPRGSQQAARRNTGA